MKILKFPQSCLVVEKAGKRLMIDPGVFVGMSFPIEDLPKPDVVAITHEHADHADPALIRQLVGGTNTPVIANMSTQKLLGDIVTHIIADGEDIELAGFKISARELPHMKMVDGSDGPQNTGYIIDGVFFHPGDGLEPSGITAEKAALPIAGPDASPKDLYEFIKRVGCKTVVPIHYDSRAFAAQPEFYGQLLRRYYPDIRFVVIDDGQSAEI